MNIGASSSCFYPLETELSLERLAKAGIRTTEIFFNSPSELENDFLKKLCSLRNEYGMEIVAVHPFMSFSEGFNFFSEYYRRFEDSLEYYKRFFEAAATLGAKYFVLHGAKGERVIPDEEYVRRLSLFIEEGKHFGVAVTHENVVHYAGEKPEFMLRLQSLLGSDFRMTLDLKQARRAGVDPFEFACALGKSIVHVHVSDERQGEKCAAPDGKGNFDFSRFFSLMNSLGYDGAYMVELYRRDFTDEKHIRKCVDYLTETAKRCL